MELHHPATEVNLLKLFLRGSLVFLSKLKLGVLILVVLSVAGCEGKVPPDIPYTVRQYRGAFQEISMCIIYIASQGHSDIATTSTPVNQVIEQCKLIDPEVVATFNINEAKHFRDIHGQPFLVRAVESLPNRIEVIVWSIGVNGIDEHGYGDDVGYIVGIETPISAQSIISTEYLYQGNRSQCVIR
jgi:hypothetical protein